MRVVLYAEGPGELAGEAGLGPPSPGAPIDEDELGAGHILVRRCVGKVSKIPEQAVAFEGPLRHRVRPFKGSDFLVRENLRQALMWVSPSRRPELAVVFVDSDGDSSRQATLRST